MKTKELISNLKQYEINRINGPFNDRYIQVIDNDQNILSEVSSNYCGVLNTEYFAFHQLNPTEYKRLLDLLFSYTLTPIAEREDEVKFRVKLFENVENKYAHPNTNYLNYSNNDGSLFLDNKVDEVTEFSGPTQAIFTEKEYAKIQQKYPEWLPEFYKDDPHFEFVGEDK